MRKITYWTPIAGYIILLVMVGTLLFSSAYQAWRTHPITGILAFITLVGALLTFYYEGRSLINLDSEPIGRRTHTYNFLAVFFGGVLTFYLSINLGLGAVIASSLVGILAHVLFPDVDVPAFCGSFVGMTSDLLFFSYQDVVLASVIAGIAYILTTKVFAGFGGKLGTIAFIGTSGTGISLGRQFLVSPVADWELSALIMAIAFIAAPLTFYLSCRKKNGPVLASSVVGILGGLILPVFFPVHGLTLGVVAFCASFTGMTSQNRCPALWQMLIASIFTGILFIFSTPLLGGAGGKLGTIGFASILATWGFIHLFEELHIKPSHSHSGQESC